MKKLISILTAALFVFALASCSSGDTSGSGSAASSSAASGSGSGSESSSSDEEKDAEFWESKKSLLKTCVDSSFQNMKKDSMMVSIIKPLFLKYDFDMENIAECGCKKLIKKYPEADYEVIDSLLGDEEEGVLRECTSDDFVWEMMEGLWGAIFGENFAICLIDTWKDNDVSLDKLEGKGRMDYYLEKYAGDCEKFIKERVEAPVEEPVEAPVEEPVESPVEDPYEYYE